MIEGAGSLVLQLLLRNIDEIDSKVRVVDKFSCFLYPNRRRLWRQGLTTRHSVRRLSWGWALSGSGADNWLRDAPARAFRTLLNVSEIMIAPPDIRCRSRQFVVVDRAIAAAGHDRE